MRNNYFRNPVFWLILLYFFSLGVWVLRFQGPLPSTPDTLFYCYPQAAFNLRQFQNGFWPLWNPLIACGMPHLANWLSSCLYPPFWLLSFLGLTRGFMTISILHSLAAFGGFFLWARSQKAPPLWASLVSMAFSNSALFVQLWSLPSHAAAIAWIPWIFWSFHRLREKPQSSNGLLAALFLSLQILAGYPIFVFYTWLGLFFWHLAQQPPRLKWFHLGLSFLAALSLTAAQWLPFAEFMTFTRRLSWDVFPYFTNLWEYGTLLKPDFLGFAGRVGYPGSVANAIFANLYFGLLPLLLTVYLWARVKRQQIKFWTWSSLGWLLWLAGARFPLWKPIPIGLLEFLTPSKAAPLFLFSACTLLATYGASLFSLGLSRAAKRWAWIFALWWIGDLLMIPPRVLNPVPNPYEIPEIVQGAQFLKKQTTSGRLVSLQTGPFVFSDKNIVEQTAEEPVRAFLPNSNLFWEIPSAGAYLSLFSEGFENLTRYLFKGFPYQGDWLDVCGVKTLLLPQVLPGSKYKLLGKLGKNFLMGNENAAAGERWVGGAADFPDRASLLEKLAQTGTGWKEKVFLERKTGGIHVELPPVSRILGDTENPISQQGASRISVASTFAGPGFWVWDESFTPGWHAWVDGKPAAVFRAYGLFMSVEVPQGSHRVDFRYEPSTFRLGLFLSLISLAMAGTLLVKVLQRDKKA